MEYKHINDCWNKLRKCKTIDEVVDAIKHFPNMFGSWAIEAEDSETITVHNSWYDNNIGDSFDESETLDVEKFDIEEKEDEYGLYMC